MMARRRKSPDQFLEQIREEIGRDRTQVRDPDTKKTLGYLEKHVFDPGLTTGRVLAACELAPASLRRRFARALDSTVNQYVLEKRLTAAAKILASTDLFVQQVAIYVGYDHDQTFSRQFKGKYEMTPSQYRRKNRDKPHESSPEKEDGETQTDPAEFMRRLHSGELRPEEVHQHMNRLRDLYPDAFTDWFVVYDGDAFLQTKAEEIWRWIDGKPLEDQREVLRQHRFASPVMSDFLRRKSRLEGRKNGNAGVQLVALALYCLDLTEEILGKKLHNKRAVGLAWLGNAYVLDLDFENAENSFHRASEEWHNQEAPRDEVALAEILMLKATFRNIQRMYPEASRLASDAIKLTRTNSDAREVLTRSLIVKAEISNHLGELGEMIPLLLEARSLVIGAEDPFLEFTVCANLANALNALGRYHEALQLLPEAKQLWQAGSGSKLHWLLLVWAEAHAYWGLGKLNLAEGRLDIARSSLIDLGEVEHAAVVSLDLGILLLELNRESEALGALVESLPILDRLGFVPELAASILALKSIVARGSVDRIKLQPIRDRFDQFRMDPQSRMRRRRGTLAASSSGLPLQSTQS